MRIGAMLLVVCVSLCGSGCLKTMHLNVANGMLVWDFTSEAATSYRIGSFETAKGTAGDLLYFDALPEGVECEGCSECEIPVECERVSVPPTINP